MAILSPHSIMHGARGKLGGIVFREVNGQTIVTTLSISRKKRSELQVRNNDKMRSAAGHARAAMRNPALKAHYEKKKKRLNVSSAYTAACTDFMRKGKIDEIDTTQYHKGKITIKAYKPELGFEEVTVRLSTKEGRELHHGITTSRGHGEWTYHCPDLPPLKDVVITIQAKDKPGNITQATFLPGKDITLSHHW